MNKTVTLSASDAILRVLKKGPKKGMTAALIAERAGLKLNTVRSTLYELTSNGQASILGRLSPTSGRPANLYALAA